MKVIILAAGKGKRLHSDESGVPKCMALADGRPLLSYVLDYTSFVPDADKIIVVGYRREVIEAYLPGFRFAVQLEQKGTGDAVMAAYPYLKDYDGDVFVINGDMPLLRQESLESLMELHESEHNDCSMLTYFEDGDLPPFGRVIRGADGRVCDICEFKDASESVRAIRELNVGVYLFDSRKLFSALAGLEPSAATGEYYLTDVPKAILRAGGRVNGLCLRSSDEVGGVNTPEDLEKVSEILKKRKTGSL